MASSRNTVIERASIKGYRAARDLTLDLAPITVLSGANGAGKSTVLRALRLLRAAADGDLSARLAAEGGLASALWAGAPGRKATKKGPVRLTIAARLDGVDYELALGPPRPTDAALALDPVVKSEIIAAPSGRRGRSATLLSRSGPHVAGRDDDGRDIALATDLHLFETALSRVRDPVRAPEADRVATLLRDIVLYEGFRADDASPLRAPHPAVATPRVSENGADWAVAMLSRLRIADDPRDVDRAAATLATEAALEGARPVFFEEGFSVEGGLSAPGSPRAFRARELSEGTLRYLALVACLTALRPPAVVLLNEPEASLNKRMIEPLAGLIAEASSASQIVVATHDERLADLLDVEHGATRIRLARVDGETRIEDG